MTRLSARRIGALAMPLAAVGCAALLRLDAVTQSYGVVDAPGWLRAAQWASISAVGIIRPAAVRWDPVEMFPHRDGPSTRYISDPYTYLVFARETRSFYEAHHREPVFPFATRIWLWLLNDQDVAVSFASASFSVLAVLATYLLGATLSSRPVGFAAAMALAIDYDAISWAIGGWRDDAFTLGVVASACAMIRYLRTPTTAAAVVLGACAAFVCLTRLTAVTFLVPGFVYLLVAAKRPLKVRAKGILAAGGVWIALTGPFVVNCWRAYGDPLYPINHLMHDQAVMEARASGSPDPPSGDTPTSAAGYLASKVMTRPFATVETITLGLTSYPFLNKWAGLNRWIPRLGDLLSWLALVGLVFLAGSPSGRLTLLVLATSLVPAAMTWRLAADWRFTAHAYPFFLVAACLAVGRLALLGRTSLVRERWARSLPSRRSVALATALIAGVGGVAWFVMRTLPVLVVEEALRAREPVTIGTDARDAGFFAEGWGSPEGNGNVRVRAASRPISSVRLPLPVAEYLLTVRLDPYPRPGSGDDVRPPVVRVFMNNTLLSTLELGWNPERVGSYEVRVPQESVRRGVNRLIFMADLGSRHPGGHAGSFAIWYIRIRPTAGS